MKIIVTAGGTIEPIDDVRNISNYSTGRMGLTIASFLIEQGVDVLFVATENIQRLLPDDQPNLKKYQITDVQSVLQTLEHLLTSEKIDAVIHSMAVSDYTVYGVCAGEQIETLFAAPEVNYGQFINQFVPMQNQKLTSSHEDLYLRLIQTPKIIQYIKKWQPETILIGFKLLVDADLQQFKEATEKQQHLASSDFVVANDLQNISDDVHQTMIFDNGEIIETANTRSELSEKLWLLIKGVSS